MVPNDKTHETEQATTDQAASQKQAQPTYAPIDDQAFQKAQAIFDRTADQLHLDTSLRELLRNPLREYALGIPVRMDDGSVRIFRGFRVQHNDALGAGRGSLRFHPDQTIESTRARAMWKTWMCAVVGVPMGGSEGGVVCDTYVLSPHEQEQISRGWVRQLARGIGPVRDVPAPDETTSEQHITWMLDELDTINGGRFPGFIAGNPNGPSSSLNREEATGYGLFFMVRDALLQMGKDIRNSKASVQGFDHVAQSAIRLFIHNGGTVTSVGFWDDKDQKHYTLQNDDGVDLSALLRITNAKGAINKERALRLGYQILPEDAWLQQNVDVLIPASHPNAINAENVNTISKSVRVIAEGHPGATTLEADQEIHTRGIFMIPDLMTHAGGVTCSYLEQVQSNMNHYWEKQEVVEKIDAQMKHAFKTVSALAREKNMYMRDAAYRVAVDRVAKACRDRGWV